MDINRWQQINRAQLRDRLRPILDQEDGTLSMAPSGAHHVVVTKEESHVCLWLYDEANQSTGVIQSELDLADPLALVDPYTRAVFLALLWSPAPRQIFTTGLGGGCLPTVIHHHLPETVIHCVEYDAQVVEAATRYFGFLPDATLRITVDDGRRWLETNQEAGRFDIVVVDVFDDKGDVPQGLTSLEFFRLCRDSLSEQGVLVVNLLYLDPQRLARIKTISALFDHLYLCAMADDNDVLFASRQPLPDESVYIRQAIGLKQKFGFGFAFARLALKLKPVDTEKLQNWSDTALLTDETDTPEATAKTISKRG